MIAQRLPLSAFEVRTIHKKDIYLIGALVLVAVVLVALVWSAGWLDKMLPSSVQRATLMPAAMVEVVVEPAVAPTTAPAPQAQP